MPIVHPPAPSLRSARHLAARGEDEAARQCYLDLLRQNPDDVDALIEFATLAATDGYRTAATTALTQAVAIAPGHPLALTGLGDILADMGDHDGARARYQAALTADPGYAPAHRGLARCLIAAGEDQADIAAHLRAGFTGHAIVRQRYRGPGQGIPLLLLVSALGGNVPLRRIIDDRVFAVTAVYVEFADPAGPLPPHALIVNAIGDADLCASSLAAARRIVARGAGPVINHPDRVGRTGRAEIARRLRAIPDVVAPAIDSVTRAEALCATPPVLLRSPGFHTGRHFVLARTRTDLAAAVTALPGETLLRIAFLDARGADGLTRKYRVMVIDGTILPLHLVIGTDWKLHYFTAAMAQNPAYREEERRFLTDMPTALGPRAMAALHRIGRTLDLDYGGIDFALTTDGAPMVFEANATMVIAPPDADPAWDYRRPAMAAATDAARRMLRWRADCTNISLAHG